MLRTRIATRGALLIVLLALVGAGALFARWGARPMRRRSR